MSDTREQTPEVCIVGLGYVGLPLAALFVRSGLKTHGYDTDPGRVRELRAGRSPLHHLSGDWMRPALESGQWAPTTDPAVIRQAEAVILCVPTPLTAHREPDLSRVRRAVETTAEHLRPGTVVILESTSWPGTTREVVLPLLSLGPGGAIREAGRDFFLAYSPERVDPGNTTHDLADIPKLVGGITPACRDAAVALYSRVFRKVVPVSDPAVAEMAKLLENIFRSVNIALVNELKLLCDRMGMNVWEVIEAAATKPFGYMPFYPGPGLGGHCIPIDPFYLTWKAREYDFATRFIELSGEINTAMPYYVADKVSRALNDRGIPTRGARVLLLGVAYKPNVNDTRESPALKLIRILCERGAAVAYHDPYIPLLDHDVVPVPMESVSLTPAVLASVDCVLVTTAHSCFDPELVARHAPLVVDTRNFTRNVAGRYPDKIVLA